LDIFAVAKPLPANFEAAAAEQASLATTLEVRCHESCSARDEIQDAENATF